MFQKKVDKCFDMIVVPAKEETFRTMALEGGYWDCIPFDADKQAWTDTMAFYRKQHAAITHVARIVSVDPMPKKPGKKNPQKWMVHITDLRAIDPITYKARPTKRIRGPRYTNAAWMHCQTCIEDVLDQHAIRAWYTQRTQRNRNASIAMRLLLFIFRYLPV